MTSTSSSVSTKTGVALADRSECALSEERADLQVRLLEEAQALGLQGQGHPE